MDATVTEIHEYPLRPEGYAEPLFHGPASRKEIMDHLAESGWLSRASEAVTEAITNARASPSFPSRESPEAAAYKVLASWREVDRWWEPDGGVDVVWRLVELCHSGHSGQGKQEIRAEHPETVAA